MTKLVSFLSGYKTYLVALAAILDGLGIQYGWWPHVALLDYILGGTGAITIRAAIKKLCAQVLADPNLIEPAAPAAPGRVPLIAGLLLPLLALGSLSSCAYLSAHKTQLAQTGSYVAQKAASLALQTVVSSAINQADASAKGDYLDSFATGLRTNAAASLSSDDIKAIAQIWTPDKPHWTALADSIAQLFLSTRNVPEAQRVELIAQGLNDAAEKARATGNNS